MFADYTLYLRSSLLAAGVRGPWAQWVYDPFQMAGYPANTRESAGNRATEAVVATLGGQNPVRAFKVWVALTFLLVPAVAAGALAAFGFGLRSVVVGTWLAALAWSLDPGFRIFRGFGGFAFPLAATMCLLAAGVLWSYLQRGARTMLRSCPVKWCTRVTERVSGHTEAVTSFRWVGS
ncbi:MAG TPA: hypothetical protein VMT19_12465 [Thermoanaerobaculaceae bacterium]|nr:hypothetical protein [Thermoanaerobaculaceae bacterium]